MLTTTYLRTSRTLAVLMLLDLFCTPIVNFALLEPAFAEPGFLQNAAAHSPQIALAVLLGLICGGLSIGTAITAWPIFRRLSPALALWSLVLATLGLALLAAEQIGILSMRSLSQSYTEAAALNRPPLEALAPIVSTGRLWAHFLNLIIGACSAGVFYLVLFRNALVPRLLAGFGLFASGLLLLAVVQPLFGVQMNFLLMLPIAVSQLVLVIWLLLRGLVIGADKQTERAPLAT